MRLVLHCVAVLAVLGAGCRRSFYRCRADREVKSAIAEKSCDPRWQIGEFDLAPHPLSRFADPFCKDYPPMTLDDPSAQALAPRPQCPDFVLDAPYEGTAYLDLIPTIQPREPSSGTAIQPTSWSDRGCSPCQMDPIARPGERVGLLTTNNVYELALINRRDYQIRKESLFLAALDVTLERYAFAPQLFATEQLVYEHIGRDLGHRSRMAAGPDGTGNVVGPGESGEFEIGSIGLANKGPEVRPDLGSKQVVGKFEGAGPLAGSGLGVGKLFCTGGAMLLRFANDTVWEFTGPFRAHSSQSTITLDAVQPLLRGGGKAVTLEPLTQAERNLLYEVRNYARFQREFFVTVLTGADLEADKRSTETARKLRKTGFLPLLAQCQFVRNQQQYVQSLEQDVKGFEALEAAGEVSSIQVNDVRLELAKARTEFIRLQEEYLANLDRFKIELGLPTNLPLVIDEQLLTLFELNPETCELASLSEAMPKVPYDAEQAIRLALENRLDLMNFRAELVDHWRKIAVSANGLLGVLDLEYHGAWFTPNPSTALTSQPLDFGHKRTTQQVKLKTELPLVRKRERNTYRETLIEYQIARRGLMEREDLVREDVRRAVRRLIQTQEELEVNRNAVKDACKFVNGVVAILKLTPKPGEERKVGDTASRDVTKARRDLLQAQNSLVEVWVDYWTAYLEFMRDTELLCPEDPEIVSFGDQRAVAPQPGVPPANGGSRPPAAPETKSPPEPRLILPIDDGGNDQLERRGAQRISHASPNRLADRRPPVALGVATAAMESASL